MLRRTTPTRRRGTATVELALVMLYVIPPMIVGLWEMGRFVQVQQIVANSAREGARLAAQAVTITPSGSPTQIFTSVAPPNASAIPNVKAAVMQYLNGCGLTQLNYADVTVTFAFLPWQPGDPVLVNANPTATQPHQGVQNQRFRVTVAITNMSKVMWSPIGLVNPSTVYYQVDWVCLVDRPFNINTTVPSW
jgi:Flp pilus assembly protein TadG